ncbi:MAG: type VI secretion system baseplate subunit TssK [Myxococcales bacterium FL481]|nr:MAG: type VI secretion system baseplate subunit TssK [Myxococcales bacterium FL481]
MSSRQPERVVWRQGMLVSPQHLQRADAFHESLLDVRVDMLGGATWGLCRMVVDDGSLKSGQFKLRSLSAVFPDGLCVQFGAEDPGAPAARSLDDYLTSTTAVLDVYVGVRTARANVTLYGDASDEVRTRYAVTERLVTDTTNPEADLTVSLARPNLTVFLGDEPEDGVAAIKVAELVRDSSGTPQLSRTYVPPCMQIGAAQYLTSSVTELLSIMVVKARALSEGRRQRDASNVEFAARDVTRYLLLSALSQKIPVVSHLAAAGDTSPIVLYLQLCEFAGMLSSFDASLDPSQLPKFQPTDLRATFEPLFGEIKRMLGAAVRDQCVNVPLDARQDGMLLGKLKDERLADCNLYVLAVESDAPEQRVANDLPPMSKIASWRDIGSIVRSALPGVRLAATHRPPPEVPIRPRQVYFLLKLDGAHWQNIARDRNIAIYLPPPYDPAHAKVTLLGVPSQN